MKLLLSLTILIGLTFCTTAKKATRYMNEHPEVAAKFCAEKYPLDTVTTIKDSISYDTLILEEPKYVFDTIYVEGDTVVLQKKCPPSKVITQTKVQTIERVVENTARVAALQHNNNALLAMVGDKDKMIEKGKADLKEAKEDESKWRRWCLITWAVCAIYIGLRVKRVLKV